MYIVVVEGISYEAQSFILIYVVIAPIYKLTLLYVFWY